MKLLIMNTDHRNAWPLTEGPPADRRTKPGESVRVTSAFAGPLVFAALRLGREARDFDVKTVGPLGITGIDPEEPISRWRIDAIEIDNVPNRVALDVLRSIAIDRNQIDLGHDSVRASIDPFGFGVGSEVNISATNVGDVPAYFYAAWEMAAAQ